MKFNSKRIGAPGILPARRFDCGDSADPPTCLGRNRARYSVQIFHHDTEHYSAAIYGSRWFTRDCTGSSKIFIQDDVKKLKERARTSVEIGALGQVEITADALRTYLDKIQMHAPPTSPTSTRLNRGWDSRRLIKYSCIESYDDDLSRIQWRRRQTDFNDLRTCCSQVWGDIERKHCRIANLPHKLLQSIEKMESP